MTQNFWQYLRTLPLKSWPSLTILVLFSLSVFAGLSFLAGKLSKSVAPASPSPLSQSETPRVGPVEEPVPEPELPPQLPSPSIAECPKKYPSTQENSSIHMYGVPEVSLANIYVFGVLYIPENIDIENARNYQLYDWPKVMCGTLSKVIDFWYRELEGYTGFTIEIVKDPIRGPALRASGAGNEYEIVSTSDTAFFDNKNDSYPIEKVTARAGDYAFAYRKMGETFVAAIIFVASDDVCNPTCYAGYNVPFPDRYISPDSRMFEPANAVSGVAIIAHEFGHFIRLVDHCNDPELKSHCDEPGNIMGYGTWLPLDQSYILPIEKERLGIFP